MKPQKAWAVVNKNGNLVARDYRLPLTWYRRNAKEDLKDFANGGRIIRVEIREVKRGRLSP